MALISAPVLIGSLVIAVMLDTLTAGLIALICSTLVRQCWPMKLSSTGRKAPANA
ncbi:hypothetical protein DM05_2185 [Pseudomonas poae]|jgi:hypothetical protein|uniref:Uncharacterized protein n=1 Tax=Pseudomonas poae TaxID=200451 RepID=A0A7Z1GXU1_9PSED|nr:MULTISPECIES: hypothetical protein [Pseudomonas fluorescens group]NMZ90540.1 hypothetical protein [Pseudomonas marginalis]PFG71810.1 hypothetical protein DM05_2185 [Pseudomonas poae]